MMNTDTDKRLMKLANLCLRYKYKNKAGFKGGSDGA